MIFTDYAWGIEEVPSAAVLREARDRIDARTAAILEAMTTVKGRWSNVDLVFAVSGAETVNQAMVGPELSTTLFAENVGRGCKALGYLADEYEALSRRREVLVERVAAMRQRLAEAEQSSAASQVSSEFGMVAESDLLAAQSAADDLLADIAKFHRDLDGAEDAFETDLRRVPVDDVIPALDGTPFTARVTDWAPAGEPGSATDVWERLIADSVTDRLDWMLSVSAEEAKRWLDEHPDFWDNVEMVDPEEVAQWWADLASRSEGIPGAWESGPAAALIAAVPALIGSLNGVPALDRVTANRTAAPDWIAAAREDLKNPDLDAGAREFLLNEIAYLERSIAGDVQLYLYDRDASRVVEMVGTPSAETIDVVTYSPGTFTSMNDFYQGGVQQVADYLTENASSTVAFVVKEGTFPGENSVRGGRNMLRIGEANEPDRAMAAGIELASFEAGMRTDPSLATAEQIGIGHSWGLTHIAASEAAGTEYDQVISLAGAGMPEEWRANPDTEYTDLSYCDLLQRAQNGGVVWEGRYPRVTPVFEYGDFYRGPDDAVLDDGEFTFADLQVLEDNHDLITQNVDDNRQVLRELVKLVQG
ncbi:hypothetical protein ACFY9N_09940 [Microbacterium sp. NPDC008134]|uniref:hypothetical protein n=1 Tax=Microbacterium sp. NPDC008134 TaxID=3364183 RepID=UPI0036F13527